MLQSDRLTALDDFVDSDSPICYGILKPGKHIPNGVPVIKVKNIMGGSVLERDLLKTSLEIHQQYKRAEVRYGDLLLTIRGSAGRVAMVPKSLDGANITQDTARIRVSSDDDPWFVFYALQAPSVQRQVELNTIGQAVKGINIAEVRKLKIFHPPRNQQTKIVQILSTWDQAIAATERLLEKSRLRKKGLMQQLLTGKKRLPGFEGEWESVPLRELLLPKKSKSGDGSHPVYSVTKNGLVSQEEYFKKSVAADDLSGYLIVDQADFVMSGLNFWMGSVDVHTKPFPVIVSPAYKVFSLSQKVDASYFRNFIQTSLFKRILEGSSVMGASIVRRNFNRELFMEWPIKLPSTAEQEAISSVLDTENALVHYLSSKLLSLKQEKKALMQQLLTGKRRVQVETEAA